MSGNRLTSVTNAVRLIKAFTSSHPTRGVSELSRELELSKSSVHRILATLADEGMLEQDPETGRYRLGLVMYDLAAAVPTQRDLHEAVLLPMTELCNRTGETVQVGVLDGRQVVYIERRVSPTTLGLFANLGRRVEIHCNGTGKVLLANLPQDRQEQLLSELELTRKTSYTITTMKKLRAELELIRRQGFAENRHESEVGVVSVAAPIRDASASTVAAMSVAGPAERMDPIRTQLAQAVMRATGLVSHRLGYRRGAIDQ
jgi:DNA-binding IclR family transcriptional regulator